MDHRNRGGRLASVSLVALMAAGFAEIAVAAPQAEPSELDDITVSAERRPTTVKDSTATVSVKSGEALEQKAVTRPADLVADEPGVSVGNQPGRAGATNYTIRGIGDNRVLLLEDGVRVPDYPISQKGPGLYSRDVIDFENVKQVEIVRGPASALHGSDALGGVVSFVTKDPEDLLKLVGKNWYLGLKAAYDSADKSIAETATVAGKSGPWSAMVSYTRRDGNELSSTSALPLNPQDHGRNEILAKLVYDTPDAGRLRATVEFFDRRDTATLNNELSSSVLSSTSEDTTRRGRIALDWTRVVDWSFADEFSAKLYWTSLDRKEQNVQNRLNSSGQRVVRTTIGDFDQSIWGGDLQFVTKRDWFGLANELTWGVSGSYTDTSRLRDRWEYNTVTGATSRFVAGDQYPNKLFPDTGTTQAAAFVQDSIRWGAFRVIPAVRLDYWHLDPKPDALSAASSTAAVKAQTEVAVSPKLGLSYDVNDTWRITGQYARGFRAPPYDNANFAYSNPMYGYEILPNPNLKAETSDGFEAGVRAGFADGSSLQLTGFYNRYSDFIDTKVVGFSSAGLMQFQYANVSRATIWGAEAKGEWKVRPNWSVKGALAYAKGENSDTKAALDSVDPFTGTLGVAWQASEEWRFEGRMKAASGKTEVSDTTIYKPGGWATFDAFATYEMKPRLTINAGVFNIFDKSYFSAQDVAGILASSTQLETYRAPGRTFAINATVRF